MRTFTALFALFVAILFSSVAINAEEKVGRSELITPSSKSICTTIRKGNSTINPNLIPPSVLWNMTSGWNPSKPGTKPSITYYNIAVSLCNTVNVRRCNDSAYIAVASTGANDTDSKCVATFDKPLSRPTATSAGIMVSYGSTNKANAKDIAIITVVCNTHARAALSTRSHRFAVRPNNKLGGNTYMMIAYSSAACPVKPAPPSGGNVTQAKCRRFMVGRQLVNPLSWEPSYLTLQAGFFGGKKSFLFSPCSSPPTSIPRSLPACKNAGYITRFNDTACTGAFKNMTLFAPGSKGLRIMYEMTSGPNGRDVDVVALLSVTCMKGATQLSSPSGMFTSVLKNGTYVMVFPLGHEDLCYTPMTTRPPITKPTKPTRWTWPSFTRPTMPTMPTFPSNWTLPPRWTNYTRPHWTFPTNFTFWPTRTFFPHPTRTFFPHPTHGNHTLPPRPTYTIWPHPTKPWTKPTPQPTGTWTKPQPTGTWTKPQPTGTWTKPTGHWTKPTPQPTEPWTKPPVDPTIPPRTRPTGAPITSPPFSPMPTETKPPMPTETKPPMPSSTVVPPKK